MRCGVLVLALVLAACGASTAASHSDTARSSTHPAPAPAHCGPAGAPTLAAGPHTRVYSRGGFVYGCSSLTHRVTRLGRSDRCIAATLVRPVTVAGALAAYGAERCGVDTGSGEVIVRRLTDGVVLLQLDATQGPVRPESYRQVLKIVAQPDAAVAWVARASSLGGGAPRLEVLAAGPHADARLLDSGDGIAPRSLALHGTRLSWKHGGRTRTASLR